MVSPEVFNAVKEANNRVIQARKLYQEADDLLRDICMNAVQTDDIELIDYLIVHMHSGFIRAFIMYLQKTGQKL